ncbi:MAG: YciI family protein [Planctomycetota bacterium]
MNRRRSLLVLGFAVVGACAGGPRPAAVPTYSLVYLRTGAATGLPAERQREVFRGHFQNMERMAREGDLLVAGPFGRQRSDPALRGIFVLDTDDRAAATALAETDPGFQAGVFALEYHALATDAPLREFLAAEIAELDAATARGETPAPGANGRAYVLLIADDGDRALAALEGNDAALLRGRLDGTGAFVVLDAADRAAAEQALAPVRDRLGPHRLEEWFASRGLERLRDA